MTLLRHTPSHIWNTFFKFKSGQIWIWYFFNLFQVCHLFKGSSLNLGKYLQKNKLNLSLKNLAIRRNVKVTMVQWRCWRVLNWPVQNVDFASLLKRQLSETKPPIIPLIKLKQAITKEFELFVLTGNKGLNLEFVTRSLKNIPWSTVEAATWLVTRFLKNLFSRKVLIRLVTRALVVIKVKSWVFYIARPCNQFLNTNWRKGTITIGISASQYSANGMLFRIHFKNGRTLNSTVIDEVDILSIT